MADRRALTVVVAMVEAAPLPAVAELERALRRRLHAPPSAAQRRVAQLGFLAQLLRGEKLVAGHPYVERARYDAERPAEAPTSRSLVDDYGSWVAACRAADGLLPDGRKTGQGMPWPTTWRGTKRKPYSRDEAIAAIRRCAHEIGDRPSSNTYLRWVAEKRAAARAQGRRFDVPTTTSVYRLFSSWDEASAAVDLSDEELCWARSRWIPREDVRPSDEEVE